MTTTTTEVSGSRATERARTILESAENLAEVSVTVFDQVEFLKQLLDSDRATAVRIVESDGPVDEIKLHIGDAEEVEEAVSAEEVEEVVDAEEQVQMEQPMTASPEEFEEIADVPDVNTKKWDILALIHRIGDPLTSREITDLMEGTTIEVSYNMVSGVLSRSEEEGLVEKIGNGGANDPYRYKLTYAAARGIEESVEEANPYPAQIQDAIASRYERVKKEDHDDPIDALA